MKTIMNCALICCLAFATAPLYAQSFFSVGNDANVFIQAKTNIPFDSLLLTPSSDMLLTATDITKSATLIHPATGNHINRVYQFS